MRERGLDPAQHAPPVVVAMVATGVVMLMAMPLYVLMLVVVAVAVVVVVHGCDLSPLSC
jgi:biopolymer transport protein ExbB/TolQ